MAIILAGFVTTEAQVIYGGSKTIQVVGGSPNSISSLAWFKRNRTVEVYDTTNSIHYKFVGNATAGARWKKSGTVSTGFKVWKGVVSQTSTSAPTATVLNSADGNYLGAVTWGYTSAGVYTATFATAVLTSGKTFVRINNQLQAVSATVIKERSGVWTSTTVATITTNLINITTPAVTPTNAYLSGDLIEIIVFD